MSRIRRLIHDAASGAGGALTLIGEPGAGKTRLVEAATEAALGQQMAVHTGQAAEHTVERTLGVALDALNVRLDQLAGSRHADRLVLAARATGAARFLLADRLLEVLERRCGSAPMLLVLEDLHWSDEPSLHWVESVVRRASGLPLAVIITTRPPLEGSAVARTVSRLAAPELLLDALASDDVQTLATHVLGHPPDAAIKLALESTGGNPLLVLAVLDEREHRVGNPLASRVDELDSAALRVVQAAAVLAGPVSPPELATMLDLRPGDLLAHLETAASAGLFASAGARMAFRHELYRTAVLQTLSPAARSVLHLQAARTLASSGAAVIEVAEHYAQCTGVSAPEALPWLQQAACSLVAIAPAAALRLVAVALPLAGARPPPALLLVHVQALAGTGRAAEARALGNSLLNDALDGSFEALLRRELALVAVMQRQPQECVQHMQRCAELTAAPASRARLHGELAFAQFFAVDHSKAKRAAELALAEGVRHGDLTAQIAGESVLCLLDLFQNRIRVAQRRARAIVERAALPYGAEAHIFQPWFVASLVWLETDDFGQLVATASRGRDVALERGGGWAVPAYDAVTAFGALRAGALDDAAAAATAALSYDQDVDGLGVILWCHAFLAQVLLHRGDVDRAEVHIAAAAARLDLQSHLLGLEQLQLARAKVQERRGDPEAALTLLRLAWDQLAGMGVLSALPAVAPPLVRLAAGAGDSALLEGAATMLRAAADESGTVSVQAIAELAMAWRDGDADRAVAAAALAEKTPRPMLSATLLVDASSLLRARGRRREADRLARTAATKWAELGAYADAEGCLPTGRSLRPAEHRPARGVFALTATERRVTALVAAGESNVAIAAALGVSRRTVESHVAAAFRKLGVSSRVALTRAALTHGIADPA